MFTRGDMGIRLGPLKVAESAPRADTAACRMWPRHEPPAPLTAKHIQILNKTKSRNENHYSTKGDVFKPSL